MIRFILAAMHYRCAYIDLDGCLLKRMRCPPELRLSGIPALLWWRDNLTVRPIIYRRLILLYLLRALGVRLYVWTNRDRKMHDGVTRASLGKHVRLFEDFQYYDGTKIMPVRWSSDGRLYGPVMDDQIKYLKRGHGRGYLVKQL